MNTRPEIMDADMTAQSLLGRSIHRVYQVFIEPHSTTDDTQRKEFILNTVLCVVIVLLTLLECFIIRGVILLGKNYQGIPLISFTAILLFFCYLLLLSRKGYYQAAGYLSLALYFASTTYGAIKWGVELPFVAISYTVIIVISSILISTRFAFLVSGIIAVTISVVTSMQVAHEFHPLLYWKYESVTMRDPIELSIVFFLITAVSWLSNREIEQSLKRARNSEQALLAERDLLEIKVEERTKELKESQGEKIQQLYRFAEFGKSSSGIFHDLMNTLQHVSIHVSRLDEGKADTSVREHVDKAVAASKRLGNYISTIRKQFTDDDALTTFSIEKEINDALDMLHFRAREANVTIQVQVPTNLSLHGNAVKFYQIILNLVSNAIDACEHNVRASSIAISAHISEDKQSIVVKVEDNGCGIDPDMLDKVFTTFFTTKSYARGMGLGLSQTKEIVEQVFRGTITVSSIPDNGTIFTIIFPLTIHDRLNDTTDV